MAKQNFMAGGYIGKLGETVGQRWKNKRTLRVYVIPHNPRTPSQQLWRGRFRAAVPYAQVGMTFNSKAPCWDNDALTEWNQRMSVAKTNVDNGVTGWSVIPIFPKGYTPAKQATAVGMAVVGSGVYTIIPSGVSGITDGRRFSVLLNCRNTDTGQKEDVMVEGIAGVSQTDGIDVELPGHELSFGDKCMAVTCDDAEYSDEMVWLPPMELTDPNMVVVDDWNPGVTSGAKKLEIHSFKFMDAGENVNMNFTAYVRNMLTGELVTRNENLNFSYVSGYVTWTLTDNIWGFVGATTFGADGEHRTIGGRDFYFPQVAAEFMSRQTYPMNGLIGYATFAAELTVDEGSGASQFTFVWSIPKEVDVTAIESPTTSTQSVALAMTAGGVFQVVDFPLLEFGYEETEERKYITWTSESVDVIPDEGLAVTMNNAEVRVSGLYCDFASRFNSYVTVYR